MLVSMRHETFLLPRVDRAETHDAQFGNLSTLFDSTAAYKTSFTLLVTKKDGTIRDEITGLDMDHAVIRTHANKRRQPAVKIAVHDFGARMNEVTATRFASKLVGAR